MDVIFFRPFQINLNYITQITDVLFWWKHYKIFLFYIYLKVIRRKPKLKKIAIKLPAYFHSSINSVFIATVGFACYYLVLVIYYTRIWVQSSSDSKKPDGLTMVPRERGKAHAWNVTCVDTLTASHLFALRSKPGRHWRRLK